MSDATAPDGNSGGPVASGRIANAKQTERRFNDSVSRNIEFPIISIKIYFFKYFLGGSMTIIPKLCRIIMENYLENKYECTNYLEFF